MVQAELSTDVNNRNPHSDFIPSVASQIGSSPSSTNTEVVSNTVSLENNATAVVGTSSVEALDALEIYDAPALVKPLESTIHPRNLLEFHRTGSNPVQCAGSGQRDRIVINVSREYPRSIRDSTYRFH